MALKKAPPTMKAWVLEEFNNPYQLREVPVPRIHDPNDLLIRVEACSYCHTDAVVAAGKVSPPKLPHVGCHEFAGVVVGMFQGKDTTHGFRTGDRVAVRGCGYHTCGECRECKNPSGPLPDEPGFSVFCPRAGVGLGVDQPGGFREFAIADGRQVALIPEGLTAVDVAPLMCAGLTIYTALLKCRLEAGSRVGIMGCGGGLGHLGLQFATKMGFKTLGVDIAPRALNLARELDTGATIVDASKENADQVRARMGEDDGLTLRAEMGLDAVLILPDSQQGFDFGISLVRDGGKVVLLSFPPDGFRISALDLVLRRITVEGSLIGGNKAMAEMFKFCIRNQVRARITQYGFSELNELVQNYHDGKPGKLVIDMGKK